MEPIFQLKFSAIVSIFVLSSSLSSVEARFASARAYLLLRYESFVAAAIMTAIGKDAISISSFGCCWVIAPRSIASSIRSWALFRMAWYSGLARSLMFMSSLWM